EGDVLPVMTSAVVPIARLSIELESPFHAHGVEHITHGAEGLDDIDAIGGHVLANDPGDDATDDELNGGGKAEVHLTIDDVAHLFRDIQDLVDEAGQTIAKVENTVDLIDAGKSRSRPRIGASGAVPFGSAL